MSEHITNSGEMVIAHDNDSVLIELLANLTALLETGAQDEETFTTIVKCIRSIGKMGGEHITTGDPHPLARAVSEMLCQGQATFVRSDMYTSKRLFCKVMDKIGIFTDVVWGLPGNERGTLTLVIECTGPTMPDKENGRTELFYIPMSEIIKIVF